eukprot:COSAG02_NODE_27642_length_605_cov_1.007905_1_plen_78_part_10
MLTGWVTLSASDLGDLRSTPTRQKTPWFLNEMDAVDAELAQVPSKTVPYTSTHGRCPPGEYPLIDTTFLFEYIVFIHD